LRRPYPRQYDLLIDIATEEFSHLEIVGATITMLLNGINGELKDAADAPTSCARSKAGRAGWDGAGSFHPVTFLIESGGGPTVTDSNGVPWSGFTVDLRSNIAAESRASIVYEYLMQFTDDRYVRIARLPDDTRNRSLPDVFGRAQ
jgi:Mn-containing catalase